LTALSQDFWLGNLLGYPAYHLAPNLDKLSRHQLPSGLALVDAKVGTSHLLKVHHLEQLGFRLMDTNLQLVASKVNALPEEAAAVCRLAVPEDEAEVTAISAQSFTVSRFHLDPESPNLVANQIKAAWAKNFFTGQRGDWMVVATVHDQVAGFLQLLQKQPDSLIIDLLAVAPNYQGQGLGRSMITYAARHFLKPSGKMQVGTQVTNIPALNLYRTLGFRIEQASYVLHLHVGVSQ
jgi:dTDP-4-amino-4,6-dideoxy-D-galactose acyltransferase